MDSKINNSEWKKGFIFIFDVLGVKNQSREKTCEFIQSYRIFLSKIPDAYNQIKILIQSGILPAGLKISLINDSIIFCFQIDDEFLSSKHILDDRKASLFLDILFAIGTHFSHLIKFGLEIKLPFRGCISFGDYIDNIVEDKIITEKEISSVCIIGPAIYDAVTWYEEANWLGIITTPLLNMEIDKWRALHINPKYIEAVFRKYDVPLKNSMVQKLWCLNWPRSYWKEKPASEYTESDVLLGEKKFMNDLERIAKSPSNAIKYVNTISFFDYIKKSDIAKLNK